MKIIQGMKEFIKNIITKQKPIKVKIKIQKLKPEDHR